MCHPLPLFLLTPWEPLESILTLGRSPTLSEPQFPPLYKRALFHKRQGSGEAESKGQGVRVLVRRGRTAVGQVTIAPSPTAGSTARRGGRFAQGTEGAVWHRGVAEHPKPGLDGAAAAASRPAGGIELQVR